MGIEGYVRQGLLAFREVKAGDENGDIVAGCPIKHVSRNRACVFRRRSDARRCAHERISSHDVVSGFGRPSVHSSSVAP
jgi:hypothetical protein